MSRKQPWPLGRLWEGPLRPIGFFGPSKTSSEELRPLDEDVAGLSGINPMIYSSFLIDFRRSLGGVATWMAIRSKETDSAYSPI